MKNKKEEEKQYRTIQFLVKQGNPLNKYLMNLMHLSNNLYNATNFHIRQMYTGLKIEEGKRHSLQQEVIDLFSNTIPVINKHNTEKFHRLVNEDIMSAKKLKSYRKLTRFNMPTAEKSFVSYELLDAVFKTSKNKDYNSLPSHVNQGIMKTVYSDWKSFTEGLRDYKVNPNKYKGKPRPPRYKTKGVANELYFTNQVCKIKEDKSGKKFLRFPKTKLKFNLSKHLLDKIDSDYKLVQVRVQKFYNDVKLEIILDCSKQVKEMIPEEKIENIMALDLGVNNLVAGVSNNKMQPFIINGKPIKSINQYYNKLRAHYSKYLRMGKAPKEGSYTSARLDSIDRLRNLAVKDYMHKVSKRIVDEALKNNIHKVIVGYNPTWKDDVQMKKDDKQNFKMIPFRMLLDMLEYKLKAEGIHLKEKEESYTSKASFLDGDIIPTYGDAVNYIFSGKRVHRGLYVSKNGISINADINAACNILRKHSGKEIIITHKELSKIRKITIKKGSKKKENYLDTLFKVNSELIFA